MTAGQSLLTRHLKTRFPLTPRTVEAERAIVEEGRGVEIELQPRPDQRAEGIDQGTAAQSFPTRHLRPRTIEGGDTEVTELQPRPDQALSLAWQGRYHHLALILKTFSSLNLRNLLLIYLGSTESQPGTGKDREPSLKLLKTLIFMELLGKPTESRPFSLLCLSIPHLKL